MPAEQGNVSRKLFAGPFDRYPLPDVPGGWELSRLAATRPGPPDAPKMFGGVMPLLGHVLSYADSEQIDRLFAVTFKGLQQRWKAAGLDLETTGPTTICDAVEVAGFRMNVANSLANMPRVVDVTPKRRHLRRDYASNREPARNAHG